MRKVAEPVLPSLHDLWSWACAEAADLRPTPPLQLHSEYGDRDDWGQAQEDASRGLPFTRGFEGYLDGVLPPAPVVRALWRMRYTPDASQLSRAMFRIALAILHGATDQADVRARVRLGEFAFATAAVHGLSRLRVLTELEHTAKQHAA